MFMISAKNYPDNKLLCLAVVECVVVITVIVLGLCVFAYADAAETVSRDELVELAKNDPSDLLEKSLADYKNNIKDYVGTFHKQERIRGKLGKEQAIVFKFKEKPFSVFMKWEKNPGPADKLLYVEGANDNKMVVHPTGLMFWIKSVKRDPGCKAAMRSNLYPCDRFGFERLMKRLVTVQGSAEQAGVVQTKYLGFCEVGSRECVGFETVLPEVTEYGTKRVVIKIDVGYLLPVSVTSFDEQGGLISRYIYTDLKFNVSLTDEQFTPKANGL